MLLLPAAWVGVKTRKGAGGRSMSSLRAVVVVSWLARQKPGSFRIVDLRWALSGPSALEKYRAGHIPGAVYVDMERDLSRAGGPGRHPFPPVEDFARVLGRIGVGPETHVVVYDDSTGSVAARLWFMLRVHGHARASVLDGGYAAWVNAGLPVTRDEPRIDPVPPRALRVAASRLVERLEQPAGRTDRDRRRSGLKLLYAARASSRMRRHARPPLRRRPRRPPRRPRNPDCQRADRAHAGPVQRDRTKSRGPDHAR